jgi:predicted ArsR family transcriptional regulator
MPETRYMSVANALAILRCCKRKPYTRAELARRLGLSELTVRRLIDALRAEQVPIRARRRGGQSGPLEYSTRVTI